MAKGKSNLQQAVKVEIKNFLNKSNRIFFNERDLQMNLALWLKQHSKWDVEVEYYVPSSAFFNQNNYPWKKANRNDPQDMYIDIVVIYGTEYVPIELKYKTKKTSGFNSPRFGNNAITANLKNQSAQDLGRYDFWKDVHRLEVLKTVFNPAKLNGIALFVTNDPAYLNSPKQCSNCQNFYMSDGKGSTSFTKNIHCHWQNGAVNKYPSRPDFCLNNNMRLHWSKYQCQDVSFHYAVVEV